LHFTSPIRRYSDLVVHRTVHDVLEGRAVRRDGEAKEKLAEAALASSIAERRSMEVERAIVDLYRTFMMKDHIGERFEGTVTAVVGAGLFVQLDKPFVDVMVRLEDLGQDRYEVDDDALRVVATRSGDVIALGDRLLVEVIDAAILRRTVYARRVGGEGGDGKRRPAKREMPKLGKGRPGDKSDKGNKGQRGGKPGKPEQGGRRDKRGLKAKRKGGKKGRR